MLANKKNLFIGIVVIVILSAILYFLGVRVFNSSVSLTNLSSGSESEKERMEQEQMMVEQKAKIDDANLLFEKMANTETVNNSSTATPADYDVNTTSPELNSIKPVEINLSTIDTTGTPQTGTATISEKNGKVLVSLKLTPVLDNLQPANMYAGTCDNTGIIVYPLNNVVKGKSETTLNTSLKEISNKTSLVLSVGVSIRESNKKSVCEKVQL